ncbi:acyl-CoA desaturase [Silanimonas lenta]|uniref:acyl-CoA desaturase n=1 Tax=Silanimonas lenta TaxID=265429 RepID=UPI001B7F883F|nr:acyl-CoA desaturase [Silanimonas lenta]
MQAAPPPPSLWRRAAVAVVRWFDTAADDPLDAAEAARIDWLRVLPFIGLHLACLGVLWVGVSPFAVGVAIALYVVRMFAITGFYHRYFSHKAFRTSRPVQFLFGVLGASSVQRGPLWWAAHHRQHHRASDTEADPHSPRHKGFWYSHMGWFLTRGAFRTNLEAVKDLAKFPELRLLDRFDILVPVLLACGLFLLGEWLETAAPGLGTNGPQLLVWGFFISTVVLFHVTVTINSFAHRFGRRRFPTRDDSRNNWFLALLTFGEGWHNNHHHYPGSARQGFRWWEYDFTYYGLKLMSWCRLVWDLKPVPEAFRKPRPEAA